MPDVSFFGPFSATFWHLVLPLNVHVLEYLRHSSKIINKIIAYAHKTTQIGVPHMRNTYGCP